MLRGVVKRLAMCLVFVGSSFVVVDVIALHSITQALGVAVAPEPRAAALMPKTIVADTGRPVPIATKAPPQKLVTLASIAPTEPQSSEFAPQAVVSDIDRAVPIAKAPPQESVTLASIAPSEPQSSELAPQAVVTDVDRVDSLSPTTMPQTSVPQARLAPAAAAAPPTLPLPPLEPVPILASLPPVEELVVASILASPLPAAVPLPVPRPPEELKLPSPSERLGLDHNPKERARAEKCLANAIYFEARDEPIRGQMAVAQVVLNRVFSPFYPKDVCSVVYQNANRHLACQFTFACDGKRKVINERAAWARAARIAKQTLDGKIWIAQISKSTHYHAVYVHPNWVHEMKRLFRFGRHLFYRPYNWGDGSDEPIWGPIRKPAETAQTAPTASKAGAAGKTATAR